MISHTVFFCAFTNGKETRDTENISVMASETRIAYYLTFFPNSYVKVATLDIFCRQLIFSARTRIISLSISRGYFILRTFTRFSERIGIRSINKSAIRVREARDTLIANASISRECHNHVVTFAVFV